MELTNGISFEVRPASFRKLRGPTYVAVIADELAFWYTEAAYANPDVEILAAVRPALLTTGGPLILASSPYAKTGVLWNTFRRHYGAGGDPTSSLLTALAGLQSHIAAVRALIARWKRTALRNRRISRGVPQRRGRLRSARGCRGLHWRLSRDAAGRKQLLPSFHGSERRLR